MPELRPVPVETKKAVEWAKKQMEDRDDPHMLVSKVREYFNQNEIDYGAFSFKEIEPYL